MVKKKLVAKKTIDPTAEQYVTVFLDIKKRIGQAQIKAALSANKELLKLYWTIGQILHEQQKTNAWGAQNVEKLAADIAHNFPGLEGFSRANLFKMKSFYQAYSIVSQAVRQFEELPMFHLPWGHNIILITKLKKMEERTWYAHKTIQNGWSRSMLESWIESDLFSRQGKAITNFKQTLPSPDSDMAQEILKDPYNFGFLTMQEEHMEKDLEQGLVDNVLDMLLEMGKGFALVGRQYHLHVDDQDYYIDLLFYHTKLKCYIVVELKSRKFDVKDLGQLSFYLSAVDDLVKDKDDKPTLGLLLCKTKKAITAEYALRNINRPIGVAEYKVKFLNQLTKDLKSSLPTVKELETKLKKKELINMRIRRQSKKKL